MANRILLIEDTEDLGEMIVDLLMMENYQVTWAKNGEEGLQCYAQQQPDLVITDVIMPGIDGLELVKEIRINKNLKNPVPIIIMSAKASPEDVEAGYYAGANVYLTKPCSSTILINSIKTLL
jgi:DNA-binding response OmpR family regulator